MDTAPHLRVEHRNELVAVSKRRFADRSVFRLIGWTLIGVFALLNGVIWWLHGGWSWPFEWYMTPSGAVVYHVHDTQLQQDVPAGSLWVLLNEVPVRDPLTVVQRIRRLRPGERVVLVFYAQRRWVRVQWQVPGHAWFPTVWVWLTGVLFWGLALWLHLQYGIRRFYRRMLTVCLAMAMIYLFSPVGRWDALDFGFWALDRLGFAIAPIAIVYWAAGWRMTRRWMWVYRSRRWVPWLWIAMHLLPPFWTIVWNARPWTPAFLQLHHILIMVDWGALILAMGYALIRGIHAVSQSYGLERSRFQLITGAILFAFFPTIIALFPMLSTQGSSLWESIAVLTHPLLPVGFFLALRRRYWDVEHVIRQVFVYVPLVAVLFVGYMLVYHFILSVVPDDLWLQSMLIALFAVIPGLFVVPSLRDWVVRWLASVYLGRRSRAVDELQVLVWRDVNVGSIDAWMQQVLDRLQEALGCAWVDAWVDVQGNRRWVRRQPWPQSLGWTPASIAALETHPRSRPVRPAIYRFATDQGVVYHAVCTTDAGIGARIWCVWTHAEHWLSRAELRLLDQVRVRFQQVLENYSLLIEAQRQNQVLDELRRFQAVVLESLGAGILVTDAAHARIYMANRSLAEWFRTEPEHMVGRPVAQFLPDHFTQRMREFFEHPERSLPVLRIYLPQPDGGPRLLQIARRSLQIPIETGTVAGFLYVMEDITHQYQLEQQLIQAEKLSSMGLLAAGIAHEINTPLTGIMSYSDLLAQRMRDERDRRLILRMQSQVQQIKQIVQTFLDMAQPRRQTARVLDLRQVVQQGIRLLRPILKDAPVRVELDLDRQPVHVWGHEAQIHQVLTNLVVNARDAMPEGGTITICVRCENGHAILEVRDTGVGMDTDVQQRIFDPFFTTKAHQGGTGLGLTITYHIVRQHGGTIEVESTPGQGSCFRIRMPAWSREVVYETRRTSAARR